MANTKPPRTAPGAGIERRPGPRRKGRAVLARSRTRPGRPRTLAAPLEVQTLKAPGNDGVPELQNGYRVLSFMERTGMEYTETQMHTKPLVAEGGTGSERSGRAHGETDGKLASLARDLASLGHIAIAFSGGVDSTFLAAACARTAPDRTLLIHAVTPFVGTPELESCAREATRLDLPIMHIELDPLSAPEVAANPSDRCYRCKRLLMGSVLEAARAHGCDAVLDGSNADDAGDYRPGMRAVRELGIRSPLMDTGWSKSGGVPCCAPGDTRSGTCRRGPASRRASPAARPLRPRSSKRGRASEDPFTCTPRPPRCSRPPCGRRRPGRGEPGRAGTHRRARGRGTAAPGGPDSRKAASDLPATEAHAVSGALPEPGAVAELAPAPCPRSSTRPRELGARKVRPLAIPYRHGAMIGAGPAESNAPKGDA